MRAATEGSLPLVMPQGNLVEVLGREVRQGSPGELMWRALLPARGGHHVKQTRRSQMRLRTRPPLLTYLLLHINGGQHQSQLRQRQRFNKSKADMSAHQGAEALF